MPVVIFFSNYAHVTHPTYGLHEPSFLQVIDVAEAYCLLKVHSHWRAPPQHRKLPHGAAFISDALPYVTCCVALSLNSTGPTRTRTSSPTSARGSSRGCRRVRRFPRSACHAQAGHARRSSPTCPPTRRAIFLATILARMSVRDARVYTCIRVLYTIMYRVQNYTI